MADVVDGAETGGRALVLPTSQMSIPSRPTAEQIYLGWKFVFYLGSRNWEGVIAARAEVQRDGKVLSTFGIQRKGTRLETVIELQEECLAWVDSVAA